MVRFIILCLFITVSHSSNKWEKIKEDCGIRLYEKHEEKFEFNEYRGEMIVNYPIDVVENTIMRPLSYPSWLSDCTHAKRLFTATLKVHMITQPPWPLKERQVIIKIKKKRHKGNRTITFVSTPTQHYFTREEAIWFGFLNAEFTLIPLDKTTTRVILELAADPGGDIPDYLVNMTAWMVPYNSLNDLREYIDTLHQSEKD